MVVEHFLAVPTKCRCRIDNIPETLSAASLATNSIGDATRLHLSVGRWDEGERIRICYRAPPTRGTTDMWFGIPDKDCYPSQDFYLGSQNLVYQTDTEFLKVYELRVPGPIASIPGIDLPPGPTWTSSGSFVSLKINRQYGRCEITSSEWPDVQLQGRADCLDSELHLNPWDWWPQIVGLFYTRAFYFFYYTTIVKHCAVSMPTVGKTQSQDHSEGAWASSVAARSCLAKRPPSKSSKSDTSTTSLSFQTESAFSNPL